MEEELERRAKEPRMLNRLQQPLQPPPPTGQQLYPYKRAPPPPPPMALSQQRAPKLVPKQPRDIETLITNNLSRFVAGGDLICRYRVELKQKKDARLQGPACCLDFRSSAYQQNPVDHLISIFISLHSKENL